jgi:cell division protein FtsN
VDSVSTVGITQSLIPDRNDIDFRGRGGRARTALWLVAIALVVGGIAFMVARKPAQKPMPNAAGSILTRGAGEHPAPRVDLNEIPPVPSPSDSGIKVEDDPPAPRDATTRPAGRPKAATAPPASASPTSSTKKKAAWREDPGF